MNQEYSLRKNSYSQSHILILYLLILITGCAKLYWSQKPLFLKAAAARTVHSIVITRDLERRNFDIFNTEVYHNGRTAKYVQAFPAYKAIVGLLYKIFGEHEIFGRYVSIVAFSAALYLLFHLLLYYLTAPWVLLALVLFNFNHLALYQTYMFQPTSFEILLLAATMYLLNKYFEDPPRRMVYILWLASVILMLLVKITYLVYLLPIVYLFYRRYGIKFFLKRDFVIFSVLFLCICGSWYFYCLTVTVPAFQETFISYFKDPFIWLKDNPRLLIGYYNEIINDAVIVLTIPGIIFTFIGLFFILKNRRYHFLLFSFISAFFILLLIPHKFRVHPYNYINILIWVSALMAVGISSVFDNKKFTRDFRRVALPIIIIFFLISFVLNGYLYLKIYNDKDRAFIELLCKRVKENTPDEARIVFYGDSIKDIWTQECSYASERKGWAVKLDLCNDNTTKRYVRYGATHIAVLPPEFRTTVIQQQQKKIIRKKPNFNHLFSKFTLVDSIYEDYMLFKIHPVNRKELISKESICTPIKYGEEIQLEKMSLKEERSGFRIKYLWRSLGKNIDAKYILIGLNLKDCSLFDHRLFDKSFPANRWHFNKLYAEETKIALDKIDLPSPLRSEFLLVLFDPAKNKLLYPASNNKGEIPVIRMSYSDKHPIFKCEWISEKGNIEKLKELHKHLSNAVNDFLQAERTRYAFIRDKYQFK